MDGRIFGEKMTSFQIMIAGFSGVIFIGTLLLMLPFSARSGQWTSLENPVFTSTSAVCVTGLVVRDTATYWSIFGQAVILLLIQVGGLGFASVTAFIVIFSGRRVTLRQRSLLQESMSAHQIGGVVKMTSFIIKSTIAAETLGAAIMMPTFCREYGAAGIWMSVFHAVSAFCNAGFDIMGDRTGEFSSLTHYSGSIGISLPICLLIIFGGIGFLTWSDIAENKRNLRKYRMQSKVIVVSTVVLILFPAVILFFVDFAGVPIKERICLSLFQAVTPRTAGFNTANLNSMKSASLAMIIGLMLIGGSPGSTAGGMKTTTAAVLFANAMAVFRRKKSPELFKRRIEDSAVKAAATLLSMYLVLTICSAAVISIAEDLPFGTCLFETASAIGTVGLSMGITPDLGLFSHTILILLMFFGRVGGLTLMFAAINSRNGEVARYPVEKIIVG